jgi:hypothetical protein
MARRALVILLLAWCALAATVAAVADNAAGSIAYLEGAVAVTRDGEELPSPSIGLAIEAFDVVQTGEDGLAQIEVTVARYPRMTITVSADTQFSFEAASLGGKQQTTLGVITGSLSLKVGKLTGSQEVRVKTDAATLGVRGTSFTVTAAESGDMLLTCDEGEVVLTDERGREARAAPGDIVEQRVGEPFRAAQVPVSGLGDFRARWLVERRSALEKNAFAVIQRDAKLYDRLLKEFDLGTAELAGHQAVLRKWADEDRGGRLASRAEMSRERQEIGAILVRLRSAQFQLERVQARLVRLARLHARGIGAGTLEGGITTKQFFEKLLTERKDVTRALARVRWIAKQYVKRNDDREP